MVSPHHVVKIVTALSAVALTASVAVTPAYALQDIAIEDAVAQRGAVTADNGVVMQSDDQTGDQQSATSMPDNPNAKLPGTVSDEISDDATVVSEDLAVTPEGEVKNIETGETVTDATLIGTQDQQPDPLAKTNGESFIPVSAEDVKNAVADVNVQLSKFESNEYGAHWGTYNNSKAFFDYQNNLFVQQAKGVIDVSGWQGDIDWAKAKADGVEGVIIRLGYGEGNNADKKAQRNISECKRLGIPFGVYWYSYADTPALAKERCRRGHQTQAIRCESERLGVPRVLRPGKVDVGGASAAHRSERVQQYRQQLVQRAAVRRIQESGRLLVHQLPARTAEAC